MFCCVFFFFIFFPTWCLCWDFEIASIPGPSILTGQGVVKRRYAALRATLLCDTSGTRIDALMSRLFEPEKAVALTSFSTKCNACSRHDVTLRRGKLPYISKP